MIDTGKLAVRLWAAPPTLTLGQSATLNVSVHGGKPPFTLKSSLAEFTKDKTSDTSFQSQHTPSEDATYGVEVTDAAGITVAASVLVTVQIPQKPELSSEGPLSQALIELWEKARAAKVTRVEKLVIRLYDAAATWKLHTALATLKDAEVSCRYEVDISAEGVEAFQIEFEGPAGEGQRPAVLPRTAAPHRGRVRLHGNLHCHVRNAAEHLGGPDRGPDEGSHQVRQRRGLRRGPGRGGGGRPVIRTARPSSRTAAAPVDEAGDANLPRYELRRIAEAKGDYRLEVWQVPSPATPRLAAPEYVAGLRGTALRLMEPRLLKRLSRAGVGRAASGTAAGTEQVWPLDEELALSLGLMFRTLAPMRSLDRIREVADRIDEMSREEAGYWLGMSMHRKRPRRVLAALRTLLTEA